MISGVFKILLGLALVFAVFVFGVFWSRELEQISVLESSEEKIEDVIEVIEVREPLTNPLEPGKTISPPPLEVAKKEETVPIFSILTREGIVSWTNFFRILESLKAVDADLELDKIAQTKLNDMFARQYFESRIYAHRRCGEKRFFKRPTCVGCRADFCNSFVGLFGSGTGAASKNRVQQKSGCVFKIALSSFARYY